MFVECLFAIQEWRNALTWIVGSHMQFEYIALDYRDLLQIVKKAEMKEYKK